MYQHAVEMNKGHRFEFGANWMRFLKVLNDDRINEAKKSLQKMLERKNLNGKTFLDIGSGSGLFSLAARQLGAKVHSFDYDPQSVICTQELKQRYFHEDTDWIIEQGSVLDRNYLSSLGRFDIVYSWGVLHHTGALWQAFENISGLICRGGKLFIAIYNDQGKASRYWMTIKIAYNRFPQGFKWLILLPCLTRLWGPTIIKDFFRGKPFSAWRNYANVRGMSPWRDAVDWVGGYPFEVAKPEDIFDFYHKQGFELIKLRTCAGGHGCNEYVFYFPNVTLYRKGLPT